MNRRKFFSALPAIFAGTAALSQDKAEASETPTPMLMETTCPWEMRDFDSGELKYRCGTVFRFWWGSAAICPKCYTQASVTMKDLQDGKVRRV